LVGVGTIVGTNVQWNYISNPGFDGVVGNGGHGGLGALYPTFRYMHATNGQNGANGTNVNGQGVRVVQAILNHDLLVQAYDVLYNQQSINNPFRAGW
jgi:hypothetical protein